MEHGRGLGRGPRKGRGTDPSRPEHRDAGHGRGAALRTAAAHISHVKQTCQITGLSLVKASGCFLWCFLNYCFGFQKFYTGTRHRGKLTGNRSRVVRLGRQIGPRGSNRKLALAWIGIFPVLLGYKWAHNFIHLKANVGGGGEGRGRVGGMQEVSLPRF